MSRSKFPAFGFFKLQLCLAAFLTFFAVVGFGQFSTRERIKINREFPRSSLTLIKSKAAARQNPARRRSHRWIIPNMKPTR